jgi:hypothetical protein
MHTVEPVGIGERLDAMRPRISGESVDLLGDPCLDVLWQLLEIALRPWR